MKTLFREQCTSIIRPCNMSVLHEFEQDLVDFLDNCPEQDWPKVACTTCGAPCSLYCADCCRAVVTEAPAALQLPFALDLMLDDRRVVATGIQAAALIKDCSIYERAKDDSIDLQGLDATNSALLFPGPDSKPISECHKIDRLVVLDCRWNKSSLRLHPLLASLPKVHLDIPISRSYFWRWHSAGRGMVSTIEAIYYAARLLDNNRDFLNMLWLFGCQRKYIRNQHCHDTESILPFSEQGKEQQRKLRIRSKKS